MQTQFVDHYITEVQPLGDDKDASVVTFKLANNTPNTFIDCSGLELMCEVALQKGDNAKLAKTVTEGITNNTFHTLWSDIEVRLNHKVIDGDNHLYPWNSMIQQMTTWTHADRELMGKLIGFEVDDDPDNMDSHAATAPVANSSPPRHPKV